MGRVVELPEVGGLHHRNVRAAACSARGWVFGKDRMIVEQRDYYDAVSTALDAVPLAGPAFRKIIAQFTIT